MDAWLPLINTIGWPAFVIGLAVWKVVPWIGVRIDQLVSRHLEFVGAVQKGLVDLNVEMRDGFARLAESNVALTNRQAQLTEAQTATTQAVAQQLKNGH